ncbi:hypothetical protein [Streptomyces spiramenti]|uniref:Uncharacterized protein n=1 Tax=Streptomyces spiramenti TaxID=2720606 RepID=A0ABX1AIN5_9ACTN|nr:hypothetical protein [Streptomyces spiramenti]NJP67012.1 hypothetical protein [Streptomyces spiramenti]
MYGYRDDERTTGALPDHRIDLIERGPFLAPRCSCGWFGPARRSRPLARDEAATHVLHGAGHHP